MSIFTSLRVQRKIIYELKSDGKGGCGSSGALDKVRSFKDPIRQQIFYSFAFPSATISTGNVNNVQWVVKWIVKQSQSNGQCNGKFDRLGHTLLKGECNWNQLVCLNNKYTLWFELQSISSTGNLQFDCSYSSSSLILFLLFLSLTLSHNQRIFVVRFWVAFELNDFITRTLCYEQ